MPPNFQKYYRLVSLNSYEWSKYVILSEEKQLSNIFRFSANSWQFGIADNLMKLRCSYIFYTICNSFKLYEIKHEIFCIHEDHSHNIGYLYMPLALCTRIHSFKYFILLKLLSRTTLSQDVQTRFPVQLAFAKFLSKIKGSFWGSAVSMILALY